MMHETRIARVVEIVEPRRVAHSYTQRLLAPPERVFPLLCPVRETEWVAGWSPRLVISESGLIEPDCVFITPEDESEAVWYVTVHASERWQVQMVKITPEVTACRLDIVLERDGEGCAADVTYTHTSLGERGDEFVKGFTSERYRHFMEQWEAALNHFLATGKQLAP
ncbi:hypothetical protein BH24PSE2_BH24PSE2_05220 [soil metagenome]